jgi:hypothetical protein
MNWVFVSQKTAFSIVTVVATSDLTYQTMLRIRKLSKPEDLPPSFALYYLEHDKRKNLWGPDVIE